MAVCAYVLATSLNFNNRVPTLTNECCRLPDFGSDDRITMTVTRMHTHSARIGRNQPCPCGSGKKYKRCHGSISVPPVSGERIREVSLAAEAQRIQRERQQGLGRPIISTELNGTRFVAIKGRLVSSVNWKTFHDFLGDYIRTVLGPEWGNAELKKPLGERHPILLWYHHLCLLQRKFITTPGKVHNAAMTGAAAAYLGLAYDLYALDHNAELQERLVARLKNRNGFPGARYEAFVAAAMIRAGFDLKFENEQDRSSTHCEFTATSKATGRKFSVEAKHREADERSHTPTGRFRIGKRLQKALRKKADFERVVFLDINVPDHAGGNEIPDYLRKALTHLRRFEGRRMAGAPLPPAYLLITNFPFHHDLDGNAFRSSIMAEGFQIPDFKVDGAFPNLRRALQAREAHADMHRLVQSISAHTHVPSTFHGEIPEFAFGEAERRFIIGQQYLVKDKEGVERPAKLTTATVSESEKAVYCAFAFDTGESEVHTSPMSDTELQAYGQHPDTFFGIRQPPSRKVTSPLELYDFFFEAYRKTPKKRLLELIADASNLEHNKTLSQRDLASLYSERCVYAMLARQPIMRITK